MTSFYLLVRVWWVLCGMERDGTVASREESGEVTEEDIEILAEDKNGNTNGKHKERYDGVDLFLNNILLLCWKCEDYKKSLNEDDNQ